MSSEGERGVTSEEHCSDRSDITAARYCGCPRDGQTEIGYRAVERHAEREREGYRRHKTGREKVTRKRDKDRRCREIKRVLRGMRAR